MAVAQLGIFELGGQVISLMVMLIWAWFSPTIWALVIGGLVSDSVRMVWSHRLIPGSCNRFAWDQDATNALFSFGRWIFISTALTFLATQADRLILGKLLSLEMLGVYGIAFVLADMPRQLIVVISGKVIFPAVARLTHLPREALRAKILQQRKFVVVLLALGLTVLISFGDLLILTLYDQRYIQAAWMLPILALGVWSNVLFQTLGIPLLLAVGKPLYAAYGNFLRLLFISIGIPLGFSLKGIVGVAIVVALAELPLYGAVTYGLWREEMSAVAQDIKATALFLVILTSVLMGRFVLGFGLPISGIL
jgi:O-antigen/teichoic acid export membrane protein